MPKLFNPLGTLGCIQYVQTIFNLLFFIKQADRQNWQNPLKTTGELLGTF